MIFPTFIKLFFFNTEIKHSLFWFQKGGNHKMQKPATRQEKTTKEKMSLDTNEEKPGDSQRKEFSSPTLEIDPKLPTY